MTGKGSGEGSKVTQFRPGRAKTGGRKAGVSNRATSEVRQAAQAYTDDALAVLVEVMRDTEAPPSARLAAANSILDRGHGKPVQEILAEPSGNITAADARKMSDDELLMLIAGGNADGRITTITRKIISPNGDEREY